MKNKLTTIVFVGLLSPLVLSLEANAADLLPTTKPTDATITFSVNENETGAIVKPNPEAETPENQEGIELPNGGNSSAGPLRIQFVPKFNFGAKSGISAAKVTSNVQSLTYTTTTGTSTGTKIAPFVQVTDNRGLSDTEFADSGWTLTVTATEFKAKAVTGKEEHILTGSTINLKGSKLTTTGGDTAMAATLASAEQGVIPTEVTTPLIVLASRATNTNGYQISNVFDDNYTKTAAPGETVAGVEFTKPAGIAPHKDREYTSTLNWTLTDGI